MKFFLFFKALFLVLLITFPVVITETQRKESFSDSSLYKPTKLKIMSDQNNSKNEINNDINSYRFTQLSDHNANKSQSSLQVKVPVVNKKQKDESNNVFIMNTELSENKANASSDDQEQEIFPEHARSGSHYQWGFSWLNFLTFPPENTINGKSVSYWLSKDGVKEDFVEYYFETPTKIDNMVINWRLPPSSYKLEFRVSEDGPLIPLTNIEKKYEKITSDGKQGSYGSVWDNNAFKFNKPIFAKTIKITMYEPLKSNKFSIFKTRFYNNRTTLMIINQSLNSCKQLCLYINTDKPVDGTNLEAIECLSGMSTADNRELFQMYSDRSIRKYNTNLCVGFDSATKEVILKDCNYSTPYKIITNKDNSLSFHGYEKECIYINNSSSISNNFIDKNTEIIVNSELDNGTYKKENILINSEMYWMSVPSVKKTSFQINFGKNQSNNSWEMKKVDRILFTWIREPINFKVYSWYPGSTWQLISNIKNNQKKIIELTFNGLKASAFLIQLEKGNIYPDLSDRTAYALKDIYIGSKTYKIMVKECNKVPDKTKYFDFDNQYYFNNDKTSKFLKTFKAYSASFDQMISYHKKLIKQSKLLSKAKETAETIQTKLDYYKNEVFDKTLHNANEFKTEITNFKNIQYKAYYKKYEKTIEDTSDDDKNNQSNFIGAIEFYPASDCVQIKTLNNSALSGFYWIKPECAIQALKVWCDFSVFDAAVDFLVYSDGLTTPKSDISYLNIKDNEIIGLHCAKIGLEPLEIKSEDVAKRVISVIEFLGFDLNKPQVIPFGYDYNCNTSIGCTGDFHNLNRKNSHSINSFFNAKLGEIPEKGAFAGIGFGNRNSLKVFDSTNTKITAILCSTNKTSPKATKEPLFVDCNMTLNGNGDRFIKGTERLIFCESKCNEISSHKIYGDKSYDGKSHICKSAYHMKAIGSEGGKVRIRVLGINNDTISYSTRNGIISEKNPVKDGSLSYTFSKYVPDCPIFEYKKLAKSENVNAPGLNNLPNFSSFMQTSVTVEGINMKDFDGIDQKDLEQAGLLIKDNKAIFNTNTLQDKHSDIVSKNKKSLNNNEMRFAEDNKISENVTLFNGSNPSEASKLNDQHTRQAKTNSKISNNADNTPIIPTIIEENLSNKDQCDDQSHSNHDIIEETIEAPIPGINCSPNTNSGYEQISKIFKYNYENKLEDTRTQIAKIKKDIQNYKTDFSWTQEGSPLSNTELFKKFHTIVNHAHQIKKKLRELIESANARKHKTKLIHDKWLNKNQAIQQYNSYEFSYKESLSSQLTIHNAKTVNNEVNYASWKIYNTEIKNRKAAIGLVGNYKPRLGLFGSSMILKGKSVFDFYYEVNILVPSTTGSCGVIFRRKDDFSYYALVFDVDKKSKSLIKMHKGKKIVLKEIKDGGILINNWHKVSVTAIAENFTIVISNLETKNPNKTEIAIHDGTFASGELGFFSNNTSSIYFDKIKLETDLCWAPWQSKKDIKLITTSVNYYNENFLGKIETDYKIIDPDNAIDSPSKFKYKKSYFGIPYIAQESKIKDSILIRKPALLINKHARLNNGMFTTTIRGVDSKGIISVIFGYRNIKVSTGDFYDQFYSFDLANMNDPNGAGNYYELRKYQNGLFDSLQTINELPSYSNKLMRLGYMPGANIKVTIAIKKNLITVIVNYEGLGPVNVLEFTDKNYLGFGLVGVGTFNARAEFFGFETRPFKFTVSPSAQNKYLKSNLNKPLVVDVSNKLIAEPLSISYSDQDELFSKENLENKVDVTAEYCSTGMNDKKENYLLLTCLKNKTESEKKHYCETNFPHMPYEECLDSYCNICCAKEQSDDPTKNHICQKTCIKQSILFEETDITFFETCWNPGTKANANVYCENNHTSDSSEVKNCKLDFCFMCCNTRDIMFGKAHSFKTIEACEQRCITEYEHN